MKLDPPTLARVICRLDFRPKSLKYYANRAQFASLYYPIPYPHWEYSPTAVRLVDNPNRVRVTFESGSVVFEADVPGDISALHDHIIDVLGRVREQIMGSAQPTHFGWRCFYLVENSSFDELHALFRANATDGLPSWAHVIPGPVRDSAISLYYGSANDSTNLQLGVLGPEQALHFRDRLEFKTEEPIPLAIEHGALLVDIDRYLKQGISARAEKRVLQEHSKIRGFAERLVERLTHNNRTAGDDQ